MTTYKGVIIEKTTSGGFRYIALIPGVQILRYDTLAGMKQLISETLARK